MASFVHSMRDEILSGRFIFSDKYKPGDSNKARHDYQTPFRECRYFVCQQRLLILITDYVEYDMHLGKSNFRHSLRRKCAAIRGPDIAWTHLGGGVLAYEETVSLGF